MELTVLALSFTLLLILGVPVAFAIGLSSVATILVAGLPVAMVFQKMVGGMQVFSFLAIPFFVFAGELMLYGGIADRIVRFANSLVGHVRGGLGMSNVIGCTIFGGVAGSPLAQASSRASRSAGGAATVSCSQSSKALDGAWAAGPNRRRLW